MDARHKAGHDGASLLSATGSSTPPFPGTQMYSPPANRLLPICASKIEVGNCRLLRKVSVRVSQCRVGPAWALPPTYPLLRRRAPPVRLRVHPPQAGRDRAISPPTPAKVAACPASACARRAIRQWRLPVPRACVQAGRSAAGSAFPTAPVAAFPLPRPSPATSP